eukprot:CAMPEP_0195629634 /NCGR_PEP_ID=MMETSP0815-20121206/20101_1 /TAXON_ID=97485 /ORGANISM="Prymnesium parvum, Strain Texoma1" /LENGTH=615 /DNA_ID=CAMNT_0040771011 /DNA_START=67 /DNA_END=1916 /DNA_ORIENTATION=+
MAQDMNEEHRGNIRTTLRKFGYAAAVLSGSAAAVYSLTNALQRHDLSTLWKLDKRAAPPLDIQRELLHGSQEESFDSDDSDDDKAGRHKQDPRDMPGEEHSMLEAKLHRAMRRGNMKLVQALAKRMERLRSKNDHRRDRQGVSPGRTANGGLRPKRRRSDDGGPCRASETGLKSGGETMMPLSKKECGSTRYSSLPWDFDGDAYAKPRRKRERARSYDSPDESERVMLHDDFDEAQVEDMQQQATSALQERTMRRSHERPSVRTPSTPTPRAVDERGRRFRTRPRTEAFASGSVAESANKMLMVGDLVQAQCPLSKQWCDATIHAVKARGLVEVRWHNPGFAPDGRRFHPFGDVWAKNVRIAYRKKDSGYRATEQLCRMTGDKIPDAAADCDVEMVPDNLQVGDECFDRTWAYARAPMVQGASARRSHEDPPHTRGVSGNNGREQDAPSATRASQGLRARTGCASGEALADQQHRNPAGHLTNPHDSHVPSQAVQGAQMLDTYDDDDDAIDEDLMCSICSCPDNEAYMLVCDCKKGFHTYCLSPKLAEVPDGGLDVPELHHAKSKLMSLKEAGLRCPCPKPPGAPPPRLHVSSPVQTTHVATELACDGLNLDDDA